MALSSAKNKNIYNGNGVQDTFPYEFKIFQDSDIRVIKYKTDDDAQEDLVLGTDYTVTGAGEESGGNVILTNPADLPEGYQLVLVRNLAFTQEMDLTPNGPVPSEVVDAAMDKGVMIALQLKEELDRCVKVPIVEEDAPDYATLIDEAAAGAISAAEEAEVSKDAAGVSAAAAGASATAAARSAADAAASAEKAAELALGVVKASEAEAQAATDDLKYMTPAKVKTEVEHPGAVSIPVGNVSGAQESLGFTPENSANKDTDGTLAANSDTKYPSQKAVKTYTDTGLATKQDSLGFTPENSANKDTDGTLAANSDTKYPSQKAVKTFVESKCFGSPSSKSVNTVYQASVDGFVLVGYRQIATGTTNIYTFTDGSNPPTTKLGEITVLSTGPSGSGATICMPVKKNNYWKVTTDNADPDFIYWLPIGA